MRVRIRVGARVRARVRVRVTDEVVEVLRRAHGLIPCRALLYPRVGLERMAPVTHT